MKWYLNTLGINASASSEKAVAYIFHPDINSMSKRDMGSLCVLIDMQGMPLLVVYSSSFFLFCFGWGVEVVFEVLTHAMVCGV